MSEIPNGTFAYRISNLEARCDRLERLEPAVVKSQVEDIRKDIHQLAEDLNTIRKILIGFLVTFAFTGITVVASIIALTQGS